MTDYRKRTCTARLPRAGFEQPTPYFEENRSSRKSIFLANSNPFYLRPPATAAPSSSSRRCPRLRKPRRTPEAFPSCSSGTQARTFVAKVAVRQARLSAQSSVCSAMAWRSVGRRKMLSETTHPSILRTCKIPLSKRTTQDESDELLTAAFSRSS